MFHFIYRCPRTGQQVQGWTADDLTEVEIAFLVPSNRLGGCEGVAELRRQSEKT